MPAIEPIKLVPNIKYPSYQLYAEAGEQGCDPDRVMTLCVQHVFSWLRKRFGSISVPELDLPEPSDAEDAGSGETKGSDAQMLTVKDLRSFTLTEPYPMEVISLPNEGVWAMKLTEPDNGTEANEFRRERPAVPGRFFETHVAFRKAEGCVECGFRTMISEPLGSGDEPEVLRHGCIKNIARDPRIGLRHGFKLQDGPITLPSSQVKRLARWIADPKRMMAVIVSDLGERPEPKIDPLKPISVAGTVKAMPQLDPFRSMPGLGPLKAMPGADPLRPMPGLSLSKAAKKDRPHPDLKKLARYRLGYVQYFEIPEELSAQLAAEIPSYRRGCVNIFEPKAFGGRFRCVDTEETGVPRAEQILAAFAERYPARKNMEFGSVLFASDARELESRRVAELAGSKEELARAYEERIRAIAERNEDAAASYRSRLGDQVRETEKLEKELEELRSKAETEIRQLKAEAEAALGKERARADAAEAALARERALQRRPKNIKDVAAWAREELGGKLVLLPRAEGELAQLKTGDWDVQLICDMLEYLAEDYRDELLGEIDGEELLARSSLKYGRPFDVAPTGYDRPAGAPSDYRVKYVPAGSGSGSKDGSAAGSGGKDGSSAGKGAGSAVSSSSKGSSAGSSASAAPAAQDRVLDTHLRLGNSSGDLVRIYFFYDRDEKLVVVGSLPKHLYTMSYH